MFKNLGIIGFGNMGQALYSSIHQAFPDIQIHIYDKATDKTIPKESMTCATAAELIQQSDIIIVAVKPQDFITLVQSTNSNFDDKILISIMAGVTLENISRQTNCEKIVRAMPNIGVKCGAGVIGWKASPKISETELMEIRNIFSCVGLQIELQNEEQLNTITALSGSGPAYFYHLGLAMSVSAEKYGFSKEIAEKIIQQTFLGAAKIFEQEKKTFSEMEKVVTSKGGTTETALNCFEENGFTTIVDTGITAASQRSIELSA